MTTHRRRVLDPSERRILRRPDRPAPSRPDPTPPPPPPDLKTIPIVRFAAPVCPECGNPGKIRATYLPIRYHKCLNPLCSVNLYQSIQTNYDPDAYATRKPRRRKA